MVGYFGADGSPTLGKITFPDGPQASGRPIRDAVFASLATAGDDAITGFDLATTLVGLGGNDTLTGRGKDDVLVGGPGDDILSGGGSNDLYVFNPGDGHDIVRDYSNGWNGWGGFDTVEFGAGIFASGVTVAEADNGWDLVLTVTATGDTVTLDSDVNDPDDRIEQVRFADGTIWSHADLMAMVLGGTPGADSLYGSFDGETITGDRCVNYWDRQKTLSPPKGMRQLRSAPARWGACGDRGGVVSQLAFA